MTIQRARHQPTHTEYSHYDLLHILQANVSTWVESWKNTRGAVDTINTQDILGIRAYWRQIITKCPGFGKAKDQIEACRLAGS